MDTIFNNQIWSLIRPMWKKSYEILQYELHTEQTRIYFHCWIPFSSGTPELWPNSNGDNDFVNWEVSIFA